MKDKKKVKRRTDLDIGKREKAKNYRDKRTKKSERFQENILEKKSKLNNFEREIKSTDKKGGLSLSQKQIEKHRAKEERTGGLNNLEKLTTESNQVKEVIIEEKNLDIGARVKASNSLDKRVHENDKFDDSIIKKEAKLKHKKTKVTRKKGDEYKDRKGNDKGSLDNLQDKSINLKKVKKQKQINNLKQKIEDPKSEDLDKETKSNSLFKDDADNLIIPNKKDHGVEDFEEKPRGVDNFKDNSKKKDYYKRKLVYDNQKKAKEKDGKLTTDDVKDLKDGMAYKTGAKAPSQAKALDGKVEKQYRKSESKLLQKKKKVSKLYHKPKYDKTGKFIGGISGASYLAAEYIRTGSDENVAIDASEKGLYLNASMTRHVQNKLQRQRRNPIKLERKLEIKHEKNLARAEYRTEIKGLKNQKDFQKKTAYKKLIKRRQMKKKIYEEHNIAIGFKDRLKKGMEDILKGSSQLIRRNIRKILILLAIAIIGFMTLSQIATFFLAGISSVTSQVMSTTYLSGEDTLADINSEFTKLEYELADELDNIENYYPGYDEYHVGGNTDIGHDIHELLSFITAKHGEVTNISNLNGELKNLFNKMYKVDYETIVETRYRQVCYGSGEDRYCEMEPYDWYILKVTVTKKEMDTVAREEFSGYEGNLAHYEALLETGGNMEEYFGGSGITPVIPDSTIIGELVNNPNLSDKEKALVLAAYRTPTAGGGYCAAWVSNVYVNAGYPRPGGNANDQYYWYCDSSDLSELMPGMMVAVPTHNHTQAGKKYGHVGIYVGNGIIRENIGIVKDTKLSDWIAYYGSSAKWGFPY